MGKVVRLAQDEAAVAEKVRLANAASAAVMAHDTEDLVATGVVLAVVFADGSLRQLVDPGELPGEWARLHALRTGCRLLDDTLMEFVNAESRDVVQGDE